MSQIHAADNPGTLTYDEKSTLHFLSNAQFLQFVLFLPKIISL
jgi:hypothetical protein